MSQKGANPKGRRWDLLASLTIAALLLLGFAFAVLMPPFQFPDEHGHFTRAYQISRGQLAPRPESRLPGLVLATVQRYPEGRYRGDAPTVTAAQVLSRAAGDAGTPETITNGPLLKNFSWSALAAQLYWPAVYLPASAGILMARVLDLSPLATLYAARMSNVLFVTAALAMAFLLTPNFRALFTAVALMPMTLHQAAAVSADPVTIAVSLVGFALVLRTRERPVSWRYLVLVFLAFPLWVLCKNSLWALPLVLLIPAAQFDGRWKRAAYVAGVVVAALAAVAAWRMVTHDAFDAFRAVRMSMGIDVDANTRQLIRKPVQALGDLLTRTESSNPREIAYQFIAAFGWPLIGPKFHVLYTILLLAAAFLEPNPKPFTLLERAILAMVFLGAVALVYFMLFVIDGMYRDGHFTYWGSGVQGRYLIPFCIAGLLALGQRRINVGSRILTPVVLSGASLYAVISLGVIVDFYYR